MTISHETDIIIIGAGIVGATAALALAAADFRVCVVEEQHYQPSPLSKEYALRVSAITPASVKIFQQLKVWETIAALRISPFRHIDVWQEQGNAHVHFAASEVHVSELGFIIENNVIQHALMLKLKLNEKITYLAPAQLNSFYVEDGVIDITLRDGQKLQAKLLIGADGANSKVRELASITYTEKNYQQHALVATVHSELPHQQIAHQRFLSSGPLAFLPLLDSHLSSIVWSHDDERAKILLEMPDVEFNTALQDAFGSALGEVRVVNERKGFPLYKRHVNNYIKKRLALIGDAAHTTHPLAGQGLNLGLQDVLVLSEILSQAKQEQRDIGLLHTLRRYERARKGANQLMLNTADAFHYIFRAQTMPVSILRGLGLQLTEQCQPLKKILIKRAMGLHEDYPA